MIKTNIFIYSSVTTKLHSRIYFKDQASDLIDEEQSVKCRSKDFATYSLAIQGSNRTFRTFRG